MQVILKNRSNLHNRFHSTARRLILERKIGYIQWSADDGAFNDSENAADEPLISSDTPDWLRAMDAENDAQKTNVPSINTGTPPVDSDTPDWLRTMAADNDAPLTPSGTPPVASDTPDWLRTMACGKCCAVKSFRYTACFF